MKKLTTEEFIKRVSGVHGDRYDYTDTIYTNKRTKIKITCKKHGVLEQLPLHHSNGHNCPVCSSKKKDSTKTFSKAVNLRSRGILGACPCVCIKTGQIALKRKIDAFTGKPKIIGTQIYSRSQTQKHKLKALLGEHFNESLTEAENMQSNGFYRIWDCGNMIFEFR